MPITTSPVSQALQRPIVKTAGEIKQKATHTIKELASDIIQFGKPSERGFLSKQILHEHPQIGIISIHNKLKHFSQIEYYTAKGTIVTTENTGKTLPKKTFGLNEIYRELLEEHISPSEYRVLYNGRVIYDEELQAFKKLIEPSTNKAVAQNAVTTPKPNTIRFTEDDRLLAQEEAARSDYKQSNLNIFG